MDMKTSTKRQQNYRIRRSLTTIAGTLLEVMKKYPAETPIKDIYQQIFEELLVLEANKENPNVRKQK